MVLVDDELPLVRLVVVADCVEEVMLVVVKLVVVADCVLEDFVLLLDSDVVLLLVVVKLDTD